MKTARGGAHQNPIPWPDSPFLKAVRRAGGEDRFFALALCRADIKRHAPKAYTDQALATVDPTRGASRSPPPASRSGAADPRATTNR